MNSPLYADSHVEYRHHPSDEAGLPDPSATHDQLSPAQINQVRPELLFLACWVEPSEDAWAKLKWIIDGYQQDITTYGWQLVTQPSDLRRPGIKTILHVEDLAGIGDQLSRIDELWELGVRSIGLTHNHPNQFAGGSLADSEHGLTPFGARTINYLLQKGFILDWAHLNEHSFQDILASFPTVAPFVSHAGVATVFPSVRNVTAPVLAAIHDHDGYIGLGLARSFLTTAETATVDDVLNQIKDAVDRCGPEQVGVGSDLGGIISGTPKEVSKLTEMGNLLTRLPHERIAGQNLLSFLERTWT